MTNKQTIERHAELKKQQDEDRRQREEDWYAKHESAPPEHLSGRSKALWERCVPLEIRSPERKALLTTALEALDRADAARQAIAAEGMTVTTERSGVPHAHPLLKTEKDARTQFAAIWKMFELHQKDIQPPQTF